MPITTLGRVGDIFAGKAATRLKPGSDEMPILTMRNIGEGMLTSGDMETVLTDWNDAVRFTVRTGDLVASVRGSFRTAVISEEHNGAIAGANTAVIRLQADVPAIVVAAYLRHPDVAFRLMQAFVGSTVPGISLEDLRETMIELPEPEVLGRLAQLVETAETYYVAARDAAERRRGLALELVKQSMSSKSREA